MKQHLLDQSITAQRLSARAQWHQFDGIVAHSRFKETNDFYHWHQFLFKCPNGFGASIIQGDHVYGKDYDNTHELAVVHFPRRDIDTFGLTYDTPITNDVLGYLTVQECRETLERIRDFPLYVTLPIHAKLLWNRAYIRVTGSNLFALINHTISKTRHAITEATRARKEF